MGGGWKVIVTPHIHSHTPPADLLPLFPNVLTLQGNARSPGPEAVLQSLLLLVSVRSPHPPSSYRTIARHRFQLLPEESPAHTHLDREREI